MKSDRHRISHGIDPDLDSASDSSGSTTCTPTRSWLVTEPPSAPPAPVTAELRDGEVLDLRPLAQEICRRYRYAFPDEQARYGNAGMAWWVHDNQHLLNWALAESNG